MSSNALRDRRPGSSRVVTADFVPFPVHVLYRTASPFFGAAVTRYGDERRGRERDLPRDRNAGLRRLLAETARPRVPATEAAAGAACDRGWRWRARAVPAWVLTVHSTLGPAHVPSSFAAQCRDRHAGPRRLGCGRLQRRGPPQLVQADADELPRRARARIGSHHWSLPGRHDRDVACA